MQTQTTVETQTTVDDIAKVRNAVRHGFGNSEVMHVEPEQWRLTKGGAVFGDDRTRQMFNQFGRCGRCGKDDIAPCSRSLVCATTTPSTESFAPGHHSKYWVSQKAVHGSTVGAAEVARTHNESREDSYDSLFFYAHELQDKALEEMDARVVKIVRQKAPHFSNAKKSYTDAQVEGLDYSAEMAKFTLLEQLMRKVVPHFKRNQRLSKSQETANAAAKKARKEQATANVAAQEQAAYAVLQYGNVLLRLAEDLCPKRTLEVDDESRPSKDKRMCLEFLMN